MKKLTPFILIFVIITSCARIESHEEGHKFFAYGSHKGLDTELTLKGGTHFILPWNEMIIYDMREHSNTYASDVLDKNGLEVSISAAVNFQIISGKSALLHMKYGESYSNVYVDNISKGAIKDVAGKYTAEELYSSKRENLEVEIEEAIEEAFQKENLISLSFVEISDVDLPAAISSAIEAKEKQEQSNLLAEKKKVEEENLAAARIAKAEGNYKAAVFEAKANKEIANSISKSLVEWKQLEVLEEKWNGQYPTTVAGDGTDILLGIK